MRYILLHIATITGSYKADIPLSHFLKNYFRTQPKLGSRDRKILGEMAYCWYRCVKGISGNDLGDDQKLQACLYLCYSGNKHINQFIPASWNTEATGNITTRIQTLETHGIKFDINKLFPYDIEFSTGITKHEWLFSMLRQPRLFIRIRKEKETIINLLNENNIDHNFIADTCLSLPNGAPVDKILPANSYVVQDASSQQTGSYFHPSKNDTWYDCCAGAGGKSLLLKDMEPSVTLTVSDKRESIIHNLEQRFALYGYPIPRSFILDASDETMLKKALGNEKFSHIICDVPCSGSGTWPRTPEQLHFFKENSITAFSQLQRKIAANVSNYLQNGGTLIYITCSVFQKENEAVVDAVIKEKKMQLNQAVLINGTAMHADNMFISLMHPGL